MFILHYNTTFVINGKRIMAELFLNMIGISLFSCIANCKKSCMFASRQPKSILHKRLLTPGS